MWHVKQSGAPAGHGDRHEEASGGTHHVRAGDVMIRLMRDVDAIRQREDDRIAASTRLLQHWVRAVTRDRVLRGAVVWPPARHRYDRRERIG